MNTTPIEPAFQEYPGKTITDLPPKQWLIDQICGERDFVMIFGESGAGKSFMAIELPMCGITGKIYAGHSKRRSFITGAHVCDEETARLPRRFRHAARWSLAATGGEGIRTESPQPSLTPTHSAILRRTHSIANIHGNAFRPMCSVTNNGAPARRITALL